MKLIQSIFRVGAAGGETEIFVNVSYDGGKLSVVEAWDDDAFLTLSEEESSQAFAKMKLQIAELYGWMPGLQ